ncbi:MAG: histidine phosphatase family protein [Planctomycetota bacterium]
MTPSTPLPQVYLARHGETAWTVTGQHTGMTDLPLTEPGKANARKLGGRLQGRGFRQVLTSPLTRAVQTGELAGFKEGVVTDPDLVEWNYGEYEGKTTPQIRQGRPDWEIFRDGCPGGETADDVAARADRVIDRIRALNGDVLLFSHSHFLHIFAARWLGLAPTAGRCFYLGTAALSILGYHHDLDDPVIRLWNDCSHEAT